MARAGPERCHCSHLHRPAVLALAGQSRTRVHAQAPSVLVAILHAIYLATFVTAAGVFEAARQYGRQLLLSCAVLQKAK
jgi:hypothetical protein